MGSMTIITEMDINHENVGALWPKTTRGNLQMNTVGSTVLWQQRTLTKRKCSVSVREFSEGLIIGLGLLLHVWVGCCALAPVGYFHNSYLEEHENRVKIKPESVKITPAYSIQEVMFPHFCGGHKIYIFYLYSDRIMK